jgi:hypothetical protein
MHPESNITLCLFPFLPSRTKTFSLSESKASHIEVGKPNLARLLYTHSIPSPSLDFNIDKTFHIFMIIIANEYIFQLGGVSSVCW